MPLKLGPRQSRPLKLRAILRGDDWLGRLPRSVITTTNQQRLSKNERTVVTAGPVRFVAEKRFPENLLLGKFFS
jgi:hypothetical protein